MEFNSLVEAVAYWAEKTPEKVCLIEAESGKTSTYSQFWNRALHFGARLRNNGLNKGERVVVRVTQGIDTLIAAFGIYAAGGIYVPIAKKIGEERIIELLEYFDARCFVALTPVEYDCEYINIVEVYNGIDNKYNGHIEFPDPDEVSDIIFTTGTTGMPKGVMRTYRGYCEAAKNRYGDIGFTNNDVFMYNNLQNVVGGINSLRHSFPIGATSVIGTGAIFVKDFWAYISKYRVTLLSLTPTELSILLNAEMDIRQYCETLRVISLKAAAINAQDIRKIKKVLPQTHIFSIYGTTEALPICIYDITACEVVPLCIGKPSNECFVRIVDEYGEKLESSSYSFPGFISCKTKSVMYGYWNAPTLTASVLKDGWLTLSDIGYIDDAGFVYLMGRKDDVINTGGHKVAPIEIEELTNEIEGIKECACISLPDKIMGYVPKLFVVMEEGADFSAKNIYKYLASKLESYKLPRNIEQLDKLPRTEGGMKILKRELR
ncbi:MAG: acyl--CoA ligase [Clostridiales bacterium]|jgi:long-chain acyl-CoA synthetase|nr:acyl--CoA ligase [Clostridiales bacterium]